jgi:nitrite reductase (NADH) large subunit
LEERGIGAEPNVNAVPELSVHQTLVVVGNGMVGHRFCKTLVERGGHTRYRVIVFGEEPRPAYDRVHLTELFAGKNPEDLSLASAAWYEDNGLDLYLGERIVAIDREQQIVRTASGRGIPYDRLILATGSRPVIPPAKGTDLPGVFLYRTIEDLNAIVDYARTVKKAAVIGGGLLGLEAARALQQLGLEISIIEARGHGLMARQLDREGGKRLQSEVEKLGIKVYAGRSTKLIEEAGANLVLHFVMGSSLTVGMVVIAVGVRPRDDLATASDLACGKYGGVVVDDRLETSDPRIYAIGECVCHQGKVYGFVSPGQRMADVVATNLTDGKATFDGWMAAVKLKLMGVEVAMAGDPGDAREDQTVLLGPMTGTYRKLVVDRHHILGAISVGPWREFARVQDAIAERRRLWPWNVRRFQRTGQLWSGDSEAVSEWVKSAKVCTCTGVTRGQLGAAIASGHTTVEQLASRTGASTVCGSCAPLLAELVGVEPGRRQRGLVVASIIAVVMTVLIALTAALRGPETIQVARSALGLARDYVPKEISGFTLLGLSIAGLALSLRKRWKFFGAGTVTMWRLVHAVLGVAMLGVVVVHTELRLGINMNLALMVSFLGTAITGAIAGPVVALVRPSKPRARAVRYFFIGTHIVLFSALPVLVAFHVFVAYYFGGR